MASHNHLVHSRNVIHFYHAPIWTLVRSGPSMAFTIVSSAYLLYYQNLISALLTLFGFLWVAVHHLRHNLECIAITPTSLTFKAGVLGFHHETISLWNLHFELKRSLIFGYGTLRVFHHNKEFVFRGLEDPDTVEACLIAFPTPPEPRRTHLIEMDPNDSFVDTGQVYQRRKVRKDRVRR
jgi:hypothetical protein